MEATKLKNAPRFGGRKPLFSERDLLVLTGPLLVEQLLEVTVGMADTMMVSRCGEAAISGVSLVDMVNNLIIVLFAALATGGGQPVLRGQGAETCRPERRSAPPAQRLVRRVGGCGLLCAGPTHDPLILRLH